MRGQSSMNSQRVNMYPSMPYVFWKGEKFAKSWRMWTENPNNLLNPWKSEQFTLYQNLQTICYFWNWGQFAKCEQFVKCKQCAKCKNWLNSKKCPSVPSVSFSSLQCRRQNYELCELVLTNLVILTSLSLKICLAWAWELKIINCQWTFN